MNQNPMVIFKEENSKEVAQEASTLSPYAQRRQGLSERELIDIRGPFAIDCDRILYSRAYRR
jgi:dGTP triphosphohydrolase